MQNIAYHGASAQLPPAAQYAVSFDYEFYSWDSYNPTSVNFTGYWDSFSVSVSGQPYWLQSLSDPVTPANFQGLGLITGGSLWGKGILQRFSGSKTVTMPGNPSGSNFLNVILDTATLVDSDHAFPSWGTVTVKNVSPSTDLQTIASQAASLARTVVGGQYLWGGKGWNWKYPKEYVSTQKILANGYWYYKAASKAIEFGKGLDCSGLIYWSFDKASGATTYYGTPVYYEGAHQQCGDSQSDAVAESDLRAGDLLCFNFGTMPGLAIDHVAIYVGGSDPSMDVVQASVGIGYASKAYLTGLPAFRYFRRVKQPQVALAIQAHSPVGLVVTDPDGFVVGTSTLITTGFEYIAGIPGVLYYSQDDNGDDVVYAPTLKAGTYYIQVIPKPGAAPTETFSLDVTGAAKLIELAQDVPLSFIPSEGFGVRSTITEIVPMQPTLIQRYLYLPIIIMR